MLLRLGLAVSVKESSGLQADNNFGNSSLFKNKYIPDL